MLVMQFSLMSTITASSPKRNLFRSLEISIMKRFEEGRLNSEGCGIESIFGRELLDLVFNILVDLIIQLNLINIQYSITGFSPVYYACLIIRLLFGFPSDSVFVFVFVSIFVFVFVRQLSDFFLWRFLPARTFPSHKFCKSWIFPISPVL